MNKKYPVLNLVHSFAQTNKGSFTILIFGFIFWAITFPAVPYLLGIIIDRIKHVSDAEKFSLALILVPTVTYVAIKFLRNINYFVFYRIFARCLPPFKAKITLDLFKSFGDKPYSYLESQYSGHLTNKITNAINSIEPVFQTLFAMLFPQTLALLIVGIIMGTVSLFFMIMTWLWTIGMIVYTYKTANKGQKLSYQFANAGSVTNGKIVDFVANIGQVISQQTMPYELKIIQPVITDLVKKDQKMQRYLAKIRFVQGIITTIFIGFMMVGLIYGYQRNWITVGTFVFVFTMLFQMLNVVHNLGLNILNFYKNTGRLREGLSLLEDTAKVTDQPKAKNYSIKRCDIVFDQIQFQYDTKNKLFHDLNLVVPYGKKIGLVGESGGGKSTLIKLLLRLYEIQSGSIKIGKHDIKDYTLESLRQQIALVPQDLTLFHRSIYDNIVYGCKKVTKKQVIEVSKKANCHEFIMKLPEKYETQVGERGVKLSGGQRQRIAIARAMLKNAPILLLDEATSALDSETETHIQEALDRLMEDKTAIVIAHRLSTLRKMDKIIVLEKGKIIEQGSHTELMKKQGKFCQLWTLQSNHSKK